MESCLFWFLTHNFFSKQNKTSFIRDQYCHLADDGSLCCQWRIHGSIVTEGLKLMMRRCPLPHLQLSIDYFRFGASNQIWVAAFDQPQVKRKKILMASFWKGFIEWEWTQRLTGIGGSWTATLKYCLSRASGRRRRRRRRQRRSQWRRRRRRWRWQWLQLNSKKEERERLESGDAEVLRHPRGTEAKKLMKESFLVALDSDICFPKSEDFRGIPKKAARLDQGPLF